MPASDSPSTDPSAATAVTAAARAADPASVTRTVPRWFIWLGLIALAGYALFLSKHMTAVAGGADSSGYMNSARLLAAGKLHTEMRVPPEFADLPIHPRHFLPAGFDFFADRPDLAPTYPSGLPLHLALGARLLGWKAGPFLVQLLGAMAAVWFCYAAARELGLDYTLAAAGAALLAVFPVFIYTSFQTLSDTLATTWIAAAIWCALRGRTSRGWAAACGAALAVAVLVRPTNLLLAPALIVLLGFDVRRLACFALGGVPGALWLAFYNHQLYGGALRSGYKDIHAAFAFEYLAPTAVHFAKWLALFLPAAILVLPFAALGHRATRRRELFGLGLLAITNIGFYAFCAYSHDAWTYLRYIQPAMPALILAGLLGVKALARGVGARWPRAFRPAAALVLILWAAGNSWYWNWKLHVFYVPGYERAYEEAAQLVRRHVPENALMVCCNVSGTLYYYTDLPTLLFDTLEPEQFTRYATAARAAGRPIYAAVFNIEEDDSIRRRCPGTWTKIAAADNIGIWRLE